MALQMFACTATQMCVMKVSGSVSGDADSFDRRLAFPFARVVLGPFVSPRFAFSIFHSPRIVPDALSFVSLPFSRSRPGWKERIVLRRSRFDRSARDQRILSADLVFIIINFFFYFRKIRTFPRLESQGYSSTPGIQCLETPTRVMLLSGYPQATRHPPLRELSKDEWNHRSFPLLRSRFSLIAVDDGSGCCHTPSTFDFHFLAWLSFVPVYAFWTRVWMELDGHNGLMRKSGW